MRYGSSTAPLASSGAVLPFAKLVVTRSPWPCASASGTTKGQGREGRQGNQPRTVFVFAEGFHYQHQWQQPLLEHACDLAFVLWAQGSSHCVSRGRPDRAAAAARSEALGYKLFVPDFRPPRRGEQVRGVGWLVRRNFPAVAYSTYNDEDGEAYAIQLRNTIWVSAWRRPTAVHDADFHKFIDGLFVVARARGLSVVCLGDWNLEPEEHPGVTIERRLWALPDSQDPEFLASTRWDGQRAIDYGFGAADVPGQPQAFWEEVFGDHKGLTLTSESTPRHRALRPWTAPRPLPGLLRSRPAHGGKHCRRPGICKTVLFQTLKPAPRQSGLGSLRWSLRLMRRPSSS